MQISVIMSVYNADKEQLKQAVHSVLQQSFSDFELIVCDDGSEKEAGAMLSSLIKEDSRVTILRNEKNRGLAYSLNRCIDAAKGEWLFRQDADDVSTPHRFEKMRQAIEKYPQFDIVSSNLSLFDGSGIWGKMRYPKMPQPKDFLFCVPFMHGAVAMKKDAVRRAGGYRVAKETRRTEDIDLFMRMYAQGSRGYTIQEELYQYREDRAAQKKRKYRYKIDEAKVKLKGFSRLGLLPKGLPYVLKPLVVGLIPQRLLNRLKDAYYHRKSG